MPDQSPSNDEWWHPKPFVPIPEGSSHRLSPAQEEFVREWYGGPIKIPPPQVLDEEGTVLSLDDTIRCREQALHSAAIMAEVTAFPEDQAESVVVLAKRFEKFMRTGQ